MQFISHNFNSINYAIVLYPFLYQCELVKAGFCLICFFVLEYPYLL